MLLRHAPHDDHGREALVAAVEGVLASWLRYRDGVARAMGLVRS
jgi:hypothetical protein